MSYVDSPQFKLFRALRRGKLDEVNQWVNSGADITLVTELDKWNYLHKVLRSVKIKTSVEVVLYLIEGGVDANAVDSYGNTPLHYAAMQKNPSCIKALLEKGAEKSLHHTNIDGITPLRGVFSGKPYDYESIKVLLEFGADLDQKGDGCSIRELAHVLEGVDDSIMELIEKY